MTTLTSASKLPSQHSLMISEKKLVFAFVFLLLPLFDMVNGFLVVRGFLGEGGLASPSQLGRLIATFMLVLIAIKHRLSMALLPIVLYPLPVEFAAGLIHQNLFGVLYGVMSTYKLVYLFGLCLVFSHYVKSPEDMRLFGAFLKANLLFIGFSLIFALVTGLGNSTYGFGFGTKGFFASGNGIGVYLGVGSLLLFALKKYHLYQQTNLLTFVFLAVATAIIGSKTAMVFSAILLASLVLDSRFRYVWIVLGLVFFVVAMPVLIDVFAAVFDIIVRRYENADSLLSFLASGRLTYVQDAFDTFLHQPDVWPRLLMGSGAVLSFQVPSPNLQFDTLETDLFDVLFMYGLVGVSFYLGFFLVSALMVIRYPALLLVLALLFFHSVFAGHVLFNGMSGLALAMVFASAVYLSKNKGMKIADATH